MNYNIPIYQPLPEIQLALNAVLKAGEAIIELYKKNFLTSLKNDNEPITEADIKSNTIIQKIISESNYPILSEEISDNKERLNHKKIWIVDPLDGTTDFVNRTGEFTIMIGLVENNKPILGVIYWPTAKKLFLGQKGKGAFKFYNGNWTKIFVSDISELEKCRAVGSRYHISDKDRKLLTSLKISKFTSKGSSLKVTDISSGNAELYFTTTHKVKQWDTCASYCLVTEAGGKMTDMFGNDLEYNTEKLNHENGLLVSNGLVHNQIIDIYRETMKSYE